jgi:hypothetical protein
MRDAKGLYVYLLLLRGGRGGFGRGGKCANGSIGIGLCTEQNIHHIFVTDQCSIVKRGASIRVDRIDTCTCLKELSGVVVAVGEWIFMGVDLMRGNGKGIGAHGENGGFFPMRGNQVERRGHRPFCQLGTSLKRGFFVLWPGEER